MLHSRTQTRKRKRVVRFPGICADAATLGVNRITLYKYLTGRWQNKRTMAEYQKLKKRQGKQEGKAASRSSRKINKAAP